MVLLDLLGRRWALRILWELREEGLSFRALRERCDDVSPSVLNTRLAELREAGVLAAGDGYALTPAGRELLGLLLPLHRWAEAHLPGGREEP
ncbi:MAG TPA: winged helix-turn-helix transcriptional regulator [Azospirillaceae bacterium]|nr:winged helix-turn-helix transcriptional regulator [Azospirillaceae bacterium]